MTLDVVVPLETIDIDEQQLYALAIAARLLPCEPKQFIEFPAVVETGQSVAFSDLVEETILQKTDP